ncbi:MAG TPA: site-specific integrase [Cyclobacteriaceae bacterium]|nr:site-specific integrase [Cyclobacteriaceae bacterium]
MSKVDFEHISTTPLQKLRGDNRVLRNLIDTAVEFAKQGIEEATNKGKTPFSFVNFEKKYLGEETGRNFLAFFKGHIDKLSRKGQAGTARTYSGAYSAFNAFQNDRDLDPAELTVKKLQDFDLWLRESHVVSKEGKSVTIPAKNDTSISIYMRCVRSVYNEMAANDEYLEAVHPFSKNDRDKKYRIPTSSGQKGQTLTKNEIANFINGKVDGDRIPENPMYRAKQLFLFSFFGQGANFKDLALLRYKDVSTDSIEFERQKTIRTKREARTVQIPLTVELRDILIEQGSPDKSKNNYVFGVFEPTVTYTEKRRDDMIRQWIKTTNKWLKRYCRLNDLPEVSTYASRHTFASLAKSHLPVAMISQMLGHSRITTTQTYLGRFQDEERREGLNKVFSGIRSEQA